MHEFVGDPSTVVGLRYVKPLNLSWGMCYNAFRRDAPSHLCVTEYFVTLGA